MAKAIKPVTALAFAAGLVLASTGSASAFFSLVIGEAGEPATNFHLTDNDANDQNANLGAIAFNSGCAGCPGPLVIGNYAVNRILSNVSSGAPGAAVLHLQIEGTTASSAASGLAAYATADGLFASGAVPSGSGFVTKATLDGNASAPDTGNVPASVIWDAWVNPSNTPSATEQLVDSLAVQAGDFADVGNVFAAFASGGSSVSLVEGSPFSITQSLVINTDGPGEFAGFGRTTVAPVPAALPLMASAFAAVGLLRLRRRKGRA